MKSKRRSPFDKLVCWEILIADLIQKLVNIHQSSGVKFLQSY